MKKATRVSEVLEDLLSAQGLHSVAWLVRISSAWPRIVGPLLTDKTSPARLANRVLTVVVRNHAWAQELQLQKPALLEKINAVLANEKIRDLRFVVGPLPAAEEPAPAPAQTPAPGAEPQGLAAVSDPETRRILRSLARRAASRRP